MQEQNDILNSDILNNISILENDVEEKGKDENTDILKSIELKSENDELLEFVNEVQNAQAEDQEKTENKVLEKAKYSINIVVFLLKYIATSSFIFVILLLATNYNAYVEIAKSYLNPDALEITKNWMYASINSSTIVKANYNSWITQESITGSIDIEKKMEMVKNKNYHSMEKLVSFNEDVPLNIDITPYENRIVIPKIWKNIPLIEVDGRTVKDVKELEWVFMKELVNWIVRYPGSALPWEEWNSFIFWHSSNFPWLAWKYNDVFALLDNVVFWDEIIVYYNQKKFIYKIKEKKIIKPWDVSVLKRDNWKKEISLMTCWPVWTTLNRLIVVWELSQTE